MRLLETWKWAVVRAEQDIARFGGWFVLLDVGASLSACFAPLLSPLLSLARVAALTVLVPAGLRALAIRHAQEHDAELVKAIAVAVGVVGFYVVLRTWFMVAACSG